MSDLEKLIDVMQVSVNRNGADTPLTLGHFLNLLKVTDKQQVEDAIEIDRSYPLDN